MRGFSSCLWNKTLLFFFILAKRSLSSVTPTYMRYASNFSLLLPKKRYFLSLFLSSIFFFCVATPALFAQSDSTKTAKTDTASVDVPYLKPGEERITNPLLLIPLRSPLDGLDKGAELYALPNTEGTHYIIYEKIGDTDYRPVSKISAENFRKILFEKDQDDYWAAMSSGLDNPVDVDDGQKPLFEAELPSALGRLLGGDKIEINPNGSVLLDFGGQFQRIDNPQIPVRQQRTGQFMFDQRIQMALQGKIGEKINLNANWDTKSSFQFENTFNQGYSGYEEDIVQDVNFGNVSMPVQNSLIQGAQNLFGVSTRLRFGKLWLSTVFSQSRGSKESITIRGGAQTQEFEIRGHEYEVNRHFFLSHFFRENYERSLETMPVITSGVNITRVEVYVTNRNNNTQTLRNVVGYLDMGEGEPFNPDLAVIGPGQGGPARNAANDLFQNLINDPAIRDANNINFTLEGTGYNMEKGTDYELLRGARRLSENEFTFHPQLGYISLQQPLRNDELLAVSYEYAYQGEVYKVGELTEDYQTLSDDQAIQMKLLSPSTIRTDLPTWDLMMKNIYALQAPQLRQENFQLRIVYRDDLTGMDNPSLHEGRRTKDVPLVQLLAMDRLNPNNDPVKDGNFDYVQGITVDERAGRIIFPVLEPFGDYLEAYFNPATELQLINKYVFQELYSGTQADAQLFANKSKFFLKGHFQSGGGNEVMLPGINIAENSVVVTAGNTLLQEGTDYTVDYQFGRVRILNEGVLSSGKDIRVEFERADLFNFQQRTLVGLDAEYHLSKDVMFTGTILHMNERPVITRVTTGTEPARNTLWGFSVNFQKESGLLTRLVDKIPFLDTKEKSSIAFNGEFAHLIPGENRRLQRNGGEAASYIDDFEAAEIPYDLTRQPLLWRLGSAPSRFYNNEQALQNPLSVNYRRARLAWYNIDPTFYTGNGIGGAGAGPPPNISEGDVQNHYVRLIPYNEIRQNRDPEQFNAPEFTFDMAFFPNERGPYNYNPDLTDEGKLKNPEDNFGAITKAITYDVDFDNINVQYIEFWMLDPFLEGQNGRVITDGTQGQNNTTGGKLYFHLGNVSEDVVPDGRHAFENGLPINDDETYKLDTTDWGYVTTEQFLTDAFSTGNNARQRQDVGLDGMDDAQEQEFFQNYLNQIQGRVTGQALTDIQNDPSGDNFKYYMDNSYNSDDAKVVQRYLQFNNMEGNSPENAGTASSYTTPDNEDLNRDNTLSDLDGYYEYEVDLQPGQLDVGVHPYIVDKVEAGEVTWYQFRIPIREYDQKVGSIDGFKSIRYIRSVLTDWRQPVVLRMAYFQFIGAQWRPYFTGLQQPGLNTPIEPYDPSFTVSSVNIEENGQPDGDRTPYVQPPGFQRDFNPTSITNARLNEQSIQLCVTEMQDTDSRAVFKNINFDFVNYKRIKMFIHAESEDSQDGEVTAFLRLGTDFNENYYEIEVPLVMTARGAEDPRSVWPEENEIDFAFEDLYTAKIQRNRDGLSPRVPYTTQIGRYNVTINGNPDLSNVQVAMLGVRNPKSPDELPRSVCVWMNELRVTDFDKRGGWATNARLNLKLADFAVVNASMRYSTPYFGGVQTKLAERTRETQLYYDVSSNIQLDKIFLNRLGISLPMYVSYERNAVTPFFNPLDPDVPMDLSLTGLREGLDPNTYESLIRDETVRRSINFMNIRKKKMKEGAKSHFWDVENLSLRYAYSDERMQNVLTQEFLNRQTQAGVTYSFSPQSKPWEPFKDNELLNGPYMRLIRDFNFNPVPSQIMVSGDVNRMFRRTQLRNSDLTTNGILPVFEKSFMMDRGYNVRWKFTKSLSVDYVANASAIIDEPEGDIDTGVKRDSVFQNILSLGRMKFYTQSLNANYKVPLQKIPAINWINADVRYNGQFNWRAGAVGIADSLGHDAQNNSQTTINGQLDMQKLYNKSGFLKSMTSTSKRKPRPTQPGQEKRKRLQFKLKQVNLRKKKNDAKKVKRRNKKEEKLREEYEKTNSNDTLIVVADTLNFPDTLFAKINKKHRKKLERLKKREEKLKKKLEKVRNKAREKGQQAPPDNPVMKGIFQFVLSLKKININYSDSRSTTLPGYMNTPQYVGLSEGWTMDDLRFAFGGQRRSIIENMQNQGALSQSAVQTLPLSQDRNRSLKLRTEFEPFKDFRIQVNAERTNTDRYQEIMRFNPQTGVYESESPMRQGTYRLSFFALQTAFTGDDRTNNNSPLFDNYIQLRNEISQRLSTENTAGAYERNAQDVLIPAFVAAYTGGNGRGATFPRIPVPNWKVTYNGLAKMDAFKDKFRSFNITHGYQAEYNTGGYTSSLLYDAFYLGLDVGLNDTPLPTVDPENGRIVPVYIFNQITISENFSPLIGIDMRTKSDVSFKINYNRKRDIMLNLNNAQVTELKSNDISIDIGFRKKDVKVPFTDYILKNDLTFRTAFTIRSTKTVQRSIDDEEYQKSTVTAGNFNLQFKPTLAYMISKRLNLTAYFERGINSPLVSNSFRRTNTAFGIQLRFSLAQ